MSIRSGPDDRRRHQAGQPDRQKDRPGQRRGDPSTSGDDPIETHPRQPGDPERRGDRSACRGSGTNGSRAGPRPGTSKGRRRHRGADHPARFGPDSGYLERRRDLAEDAGDGPRPRITGCRTPRSSPGPPTTATPVEPSLGSLGPPREPRPRPRPASTVRQSAKVERRQPDPCNHASAGRADSQFRWFTPKGRAEGVGPGPLDQPGRVDASGR